MLVCLFPPMGGGPIGGGPADILLVDDPRARQKVLDDATTHTKSLKGDRKTKMRSSSVPGGESEAEIVQKRTLILRGLPGEEGARRSGLLQDFFSYGAVVRWVGSSECILAFPTEKQTRSAYDAAASRAAYNILQIGDLDASSQASYLSVAAVMHEELKPERDSRVANRLIGAALGIKVPLKKSSEAEAPLPKEKPKPVVDAWDD